MKCSSGRRKKCGGKCGSCENVKEKCVIKKKGRMEFAPKGEGTAVNKVFDCQREKYVFWPFGWL